MTTVSIRREPSGPLAFLIALVLAVAMVAVLSRLADPIPPAWDALYYVDMAETGIWDNPGLVAPFAYRPGMPLLSKAVASVLLVPVTRGFELVALGSAVVFLLAVFGLARSFTRRFGLALVTMVLLGSYATHVKFPLSFSTLVDVAAYPLMALATWALARRRIAACVVISGVGVLLFKEFLAVPLLLAVGQLGWRWWRHPSANNATRLLLAAGIAGAVIVLPRVLIPVVETAQFIDPLNDPATLWRLVRAPLDEYRCFNVVYALVGYWLPTLVLLTRRRLDRLVEDLREMGALGAVLGSLALVVVLTMYGGTNIMVFVAYGVGAQAVVLALILRRGVGWAELAWAVGATVVYGKMLLSIPLPEHGFEAYIDFYGGWSSRVTLSSVVRLVEAVVLVVGGGVVRRAAEVYREARCRQPLP